ncbi:nucleotidyltransferase family protein [Streptomyces sp. NRRL S-340]|uniref:nucleotidyltransferase family protein n=1 Tax=Streptomyces sp. NRRL S-340 TaxID=1463901 RepID=UPI000560EC89|nr:nucleotidyltransferase family protein [Streptomyces sp. NRRL S-340]
MAGDGGGAAPARRGGPAGLRLAAGAAERPAPPTPQAAQDLTPQAPQDPAPQAEGGLTARAPREHPPQEPQQLPRDRNQAILEATKQVGALLKRKGHPFALAGSVAVYAHGGSENLQHDADFCVLPDDARAVAATLRESGLTVYEPPEDWLIKAKCFDQDIDVIFVLAHQPVSREMLGRAEELSVDSVRMPVLAPTDLLWSLIAAFSEHHCDFGAVLPIARALREKVDWDRVRRACGDDPMPASFFFLLERLNVIAPPKEPS